MTHMTVRLTDDQKAQIQAAAEAENMKPATWANRELRRALRRAQIRAYQGPDDETRAWMSEGAAQGEELLRRTAAAENRAA